MSGANSELVAQVKQYQRKGEEYKQRWYSFVQSKGSPNYDPNRHDVTTLRDFLLKVERGEIEVDENVRRGSHLNASEAAKAQLVMQVKSFQRMGDESKQKWRTFLHMKGSIHYDPNRQDISVLKEFLIKENVVKLLEEREAARGKHKQKVHAENWTCAKCGDYQFGRNTECRMCGQTRELNNQPQPWKCHNCFHEQPTENITCIMCGEPNPRPAGQDQSAAGAHKARHQNWICPNPECGDYQFGRNLECRVCGTAKPEVLRPDQVWYFEDTPEGKAQAAQEAAGLPTTWACPKCYDNQPAENTACRTCGEPHYIQNPAEYMAAYMAMAASMGADMSGFTFDLSAASSGSAETGAEVTVASTEEFGSRPLSMRQYDPVAFDKASLEAAISGSVEDIVIPATELPPQILPSESDQPQAAASGSADGGARSALSSLKLSELRERAKGLGVSQSDEIKALDADNPKQSFIELIIAAEGVSKPRTDDSADRQKKSKEDGGGGAYDPEAAAAEPSKGSSSRRDERRDDKSRRDDESRRSNRDLAPAKKVTDDPGRRSRRDRDDSPDARGGRRRDRRDDDDDRVRSSRAGRDDSTKDRSRAEEEDTAKVPGRRDGLIEFGFGIVRKSGKDDEVRLPSAQYTPSRVLSSSFGRIHEEKVFIRDDGTRIPESAMPAEAKKQAEEAERKKKAQAEAAKAAAAGKAEAGKSSDAPAKDRIQEAMDAQPDRMKRKYGGREGGFDVKTDPSDSGKRKSKWDDLTPQIAVLPPAMPPALAMYPPVHNSTGMGQQRTPWAAGFRHMQDPSKPPQGRHGDWICVQCGNINFSSRKVCHNDKCKASPVGAERIGVKPGDWICLVCGDLVFASKYKCNMCNTPKGGPFQGAGQPGMALETAVNVPGAMAPDWKCKNCGDVQTTNNAVCRMCGDPQNRAATAGMSTAAFVNTVWNWNSLPMGAGLNPTQLGGGAGPNLRSTPY